MIDEYVRIAKERDILIAEVGVWDSPFHPDLAKAQTVRKVCEEQLRLADYIHAVCCVNVSGAVGEVWYGCYKENFSEQTYWKNVEFIQKLCDRVKPVHSCFTLESMQWMLPDSPEKYLKLIKDVDRIKFRVHMDVVNFIKDPYTYTHIPELMGKAFDLLGPYIVSCHLKDCCMAPGVTVSIQEVPIGEGVVDIAEYFERIGQLAEDIPVLLEHQPDMVAYAREMEWLKKYFPAVMYQVE